MLPRHSEGTYQEKELTSNSSGNTRSQSTQLAEPLWTASGLKSEIGASRRISTPLKKKAQAGRWLVDPSLKILVNEEEAIFLRPLLSHLPASPPPAPPPPTSTNRKRKE